MSAHDIEVVPVDGGYQAQCITCEHWHSDVFVTEDGAAEAAQWHHTNGSRFTGEHEASNPQEGGQ